MAAYKTWLVGITKTVAQAYALSERGERLGGVCKSPARCAQGLRTGEGISVSSSLWIKKRHCNAVRSGLERLSFFSLVNTSRLPLLMECIIRNHWPSIDNAHPEVNYAESTF